MRKELNDDLASQESSAHGGQGLGDRAGSAESSVQGFQHSRMRWLFTLKLDSWTRRQVTRFGLKSWT